MENKTGVRTWCVMAHAGASKVREIGPFIHLTVTEGPSRSEMRRRARETREKTRKGKMEIFNERLPAEFGGKFAFVRVFSGWLITDGGTQTPGEVA